MKVIKVVVFILLFGSVIGCAFAQSEIKPLQIGDQVPDLEFTNLINSDKKIIKLSDYKGKLIILDFFATWCVPCVRALPHLDSLQRQFKDEIVILPITLEKEKTIHNFLEKQPHLKMSLPYIFGTYLNEHFPHKIVPHEIWIDGSGKIIAITDGEEVTEENIRKAISGDTVMNFKQKFDLVDRNETAPFMAGFFGSYKFKPEQMLYNSILIEGFEGLPGIAQTNAFVKNGQSYLQCTNNFVSRLYWTALLDVTGPFSANSQDVSNDFYEKKEFYKQMYNRVVWEAKDSSLYFGPDNRAEMSKRPWKEFVYHYELRMPTIDNVAFKKVMLDDLNRFFALKHGIEGLLEKRKVKCYALTKTGSGNQIKSRGGKPRVDLRDGVNQFKVSNSRIDDIMWIWLSYHIQEFPIPIINETDYNEPVDFDLGEVDPNDFYAVKDKLRKFGLEFTLVERELDMIVIRDIKK